MYAPCCVLCVMLYVGCAPCCVLLYVCSMLCVVCDVVCRLCSMLCVVCVVQISGWVLNPSQPQRQHRRRARSRYHGANLRPRSPAAAKRRAKRAAKKPVLVQAESWSRGSWISWLDLHPTTSTAWVWAWSAAGSNRNKMPKYVTKSRQLTCGCDRKTPPQRKLAL